MTAFRPGSAWDTWQKAGRKYARDHERSGNPHYRPNAAAEAYATARGYEGGNSRQTCVRAFIDGADAYNNERRDASQHAAEARRGGAG